MKKRALAAGLMLMAALAACNLANAPGQGGSETIISGAPVVRIAAPLPNATYLEGVSVNIQAAISNAGADIERVEILVDNEVTATLPQPNTAGAPTFSIAQPWTAAGAGQHTVAVTAFRADGSSSEPASVNITVVAQGAAATPSRTPGSSAESTDEASNSNDNTNGSSSQSVNASPAASNTPAPPTDSPEPEASDTPSRPQVTFSQGVNLRRGPSVKFAPPIGSYATGQTADVLAKNQAGDWYKIRGTNGEGWVSAQFVTVSGNVDSITIDNGPPVPTDTPVFTATPVATAVPPTAVTNANLVLGNVGFTPALPAKCGQTIEIKIDVANLGQTATSTGGTISIKDFWNGQEQASTTGAFPVINPNQTLNIGGIFLTITTNVDADHKIVVVLNPNGAVPETTNADNSREYAYRLAAGC
jgi:hypothetical protein